MMAASTLIKNRALSGDEPNELLEMVNGQLCRNNDTGMFVTAFVGIFDAGRNILRYANAGHNPPLILRRSQTERSQTAEWLPVSPGLALGVMENVKFAAQETEFQDGDFLLLYTDGVTEAMNENLELFGEERLRDLLSAMADREPKKMVDAVNAEIEDFAGGAPQADDITLLAFYKLH